MARTWSRCQSLPASRFTKRPEPIAPEVLIEQRTGGKAKNDARPYQHQCIPWSHDHGKHCPYQEPEDSNNELFDVTLGHMSSSSVTRAFSQSAPIWPESSVAGGPEDALAQLAPIPASPRRRRLRRRYRSPDRSVAWKAVISAFGTISQVGPPVLEHPERTSLAGLLPTVMFQAHVERNAGRLS